MGIFRPNKLGYTSEDVEKKSNSYIMTVVERFIENINKTVYTFKTDVDRAIKQQDSDILGISDNVAALSDALDAEAIERGNADVVLRENINSINLNLDDERNIRQTADENLQREISDEINNRSNLFSEFDTKYENITGEIKRNLNMEIAQREGTNAMHDSQITELYSKKADKTEVEGLIKDVDLSGYYTKDEIDGKMGSVDTALDNIIIIQNKLLGV